MDFLLTTLLSYLLIYGYIAIAVIIFTSAVIVPFPTNTLLLAAGAFASQGYFNVFGVFAAALAANIIGDCTDYALTKIWGTRIITAEHLRRFSALAKVEQFVRSHVRLTILVTRFLGTPGVIVNFLCGLSGVSVGTFVLYDVIGNVLDIGFFVFAGYWLGFYTEAYSDIASLVGWIVLIVLAIFVIWKIAWKGNHKTGNS